MAHKHAEFWIFFCSLATFLNIAIITTPVAAGPYADSAHGHATAGVRRTGVAIPPYCIGNCVHCHEQHASIDGSEPSPPALLNGPSPYALFADTFDTTITANPYNQNDNFCFYCHTGSGSLQSGGITNEDYATTFGSSTVGTPAGILEAFNLDTYHNLYDLWDFSQTQFSSYFTSDTNPCLACHNPHLAKRNCSDPDDPTLAAISRPTDHNSLWGADASERMDNYDYQPPVISLAPSYEPGGTATEDSSLTPDFVTFCSDCHNTSTTITSTPLGRNLYHLDWSSSGDKHGINPATGSTSRDIVAPYEALYADQTNYTLSCLDCHEAHGSPNSFLVRRAVNGKPPNADIIFSATPPDNQDIILSAKGLITVGTNPTMDGLCVSCHISSNSNIHHLNADAPYLQKSCAFCHGAGGVDKILCEQCHFHGSTVFIPADESKTGIANTRKTF
ncbi:MAG: hypothetical protein JXO50_00510 [Deltaproteobacteria bacterium]|nr:hypothetical protein [Candidatus Anaeroferrophillus wilburensis]